MGLFVLKLFILGKFSARGSENVFSFQPMLVGHGQRIERFESEKEKFNFIQEEKTVRKSRALPSRTCRLSKIYIEIEPF